MYLVVFKRGSNKLPGQSHLISCLIIVIIESLVAVAGSVGQVTTKPVINLTIQNSSNYFI